MFFSLLLGAGITACNSNTSSSNTSSNYQFCAYQQIYSEAELAKNSSLFPTFDDAVVIKLEGAGETHSIHYRISQNDSFYLNLNSGKVASVSLEDLSGNQKAHFTSRNENVPVSLEAGDYWMKVQGNPDASGRLVIQPGGCNTSGSSSLSTGLSFRDSVTSTYEHPGVYINEIAFAQTLIGVPTNVTAFVGAIPQGTLNKPYFISSWNEYVNYFGGLNNDFPLSYSVYAFYQQGGQNAYVIGASNAASPPSVNQLLSGGLSVLDGVDNPPPNLLVFPDLINMTSSDVSLLAQSVVPYVNARGEILILDPPQGMDNPQQIINFVQQGLANLSLENTVMYYPYITIMNPFTGQSYTLGPAGILAGLYAYVDLTEGVWDAPANINLGIVTSLTYALSNEENGLLDELGINALRYFTSKGNVVWGSRTLAPNNEAFRYINLRRLYLFIQQSVNEGLQWIVFEPNDGTLWVDITSSVSNFMTILWQQGALMGATASDAFQVLCGFQNNTSQDILNGFLNVTVEYAPVTSGEFQVIDEQFIMQGN